jgi:potassium efflux system protein
MHMISRLPLLLLALCLPVVPALAAGPSGIPAPLAGDIARLESRLGESRLDDASRSSVEAQLAQARADDRAADEALAASAALQAEASQAGDELPRLEAALRRPLRTVLREWEERLPPRESLDALTRRIEETRSRLGSQRESLNAANAALDALTTTSLALAGELADQRRLVEERRDAADAARALARSSDSPVAQARALAAEAALRLALATLHRLETEQETLPARQRLWEARRRARERELNLAEQQLAVLQTRLEERRASLAEALRLRLEAERQEFAGSSPEAETLARENQALGEQLLALENELFAQRRAAAASARELLQAEESLRNTRARLALGGSDEALGLLLLGERRRLADPARLQRQLDTVRRRYAAARLSLIDLAERSSELDNLAEAVDRRLAGHEDDVADEDVIAQRREAYYRLLGTRAELLPELVDTTRQLAAVLGELERTLQAQLETTRTLSTMLDRRLLWVRSHAPVDPAWLSRVPAGWADLFKPSRYLTALRLGGRAALERWPQTLVLLSALALGLWLRRRLPDELERCARPLRSVRQDAYRHTLRALLLTLLAATPLAVLLAGAGWLFSVAGEAGRFSHSLGRALLLAAPTAYLYSLLGLMLRERGLLPTHLRWSAGTLAALAWLRPWLLWALLPLHLLVNLAFLRNVDPALETAGRMMLAGLALIYAWLAWRLLAPDGLWPGRRGADSLLRRVLRGLLPAGLVALALLALAGYLLTAGVLLRNLWLSFLLVLAVALLHGLVSRWLLLGERRLALRRYEARREAENEAGEEHPADTGEALPEVEPEEINLHSVNTQTRRLQRAFTLSLLAAALVWAWIDTLPAISRLDELALWHIADVDAEGRPVRLAVSLQDLLFGALVLALTFVAARNLPGLVEIGLLSKIQVDAPTRYAITSVSRYLIVIVGLLTGLSLFGVRWSQLQWMAAALTVGLGFGLQEIFANFVSGLILLFERPFRVGDIITIGDLTGTVTRIRTRATTLVDFDNKEIVVPNKTFITGQLVNWTLSDTRTRIIVKVGVAYGSDPALVHRLLMQAAEEHPKVLAEPAPRSWFMAFGASALEFELRVFVSEIADRLRTLNDLNSRIAELFAEHGIEIAFPQLDIHVRDLPPRADEAPAGG